MVLRRYVLPYCFSTRRMKRNKRMKTPYDYHLVEALKSASPCVYMCLIRLFVRSG